MAFRVVNHVNNLMLHTLESYQGAFPLIFINSLGTNLGIWDSVVSKLDQRLRVIRYDKRGHGLSDCPTGPYTIRDHADDLGALLDSLDIEKAVLVGISVGGMIALDFAAHHPDRVRALVLCDTGATIGNATTWNERIDTLTRHGMAYLAESIAARWVTPAFQKSKPAMWHGCLNLLARTPLAGYIATCEAIRDADLSDAARAITAPTLVLCGDSDVSTPPDSGRALAALIPGARFELIAGAAHLPCLEQPDLLAQQINDFLMRLPLSVITERGAGGEVNPFAQGMAIRRAVLGDAHVDRAEANTTPFDADFQRFITEVAWGKVWARPHFDPKTRHLLTLAMLAALGKEKELQMHIRATENTGVTPDDLREVFMQVAIYAGVPAANRAFAIAKSWYSYRAFSSEDD